MHACWRAIILDSPHPHSRSQSQHRQDSNPALAVRMASWGEGIAPLVVGDDELRQGGRHGWLGGYSTESGDGRKEEEEEVRQSTAQLAGWL